jgi:hypothetical protein
MEEPERFYHGLGAALRVEGMTYFVSNYHAIQAGLDAAVEVAINYKIFEKKCVSAQAFCRHLIDVGAAYCESPYFERFIFNGGRRTGDLLLEDHLEKENLPKSAIVGYCYAAEAFRKAFHEECKRQDRQ